MEKYKEGERVGIRLSAKLKPADYEGLEATVWFETTILPKESVAKAFQRVEKEVVAELQKGIVSVFKAAGYDPPI